MRPFQSISLTYRDQKTLSCLCYTIGQTPLDLNDNEAEINATTCMFNVISSIYGYIIPLKFSTIGPGVK